MRHTPPKASPRVRVPASPRRACRTARSILLGPGPERPSSGLSPTNAFSAQVQLTRRLEPETVGAWENGQGVNRTPDTQIFSLLLYQLSYLARLPKRSRCDNEPVKSSQQAGNRRRFSIVFSGSRRSPDVGACRGSRHGEVGRMRERAEPTAFCCTLLHHCCTGGALCFIIRGEPVTMSSLIPRRRGAP